MNKMNKITKFFKRNKPQKTPTKVAFQRFSQFKNSQSVIQNQIPNHLESIRPGFPNPIDRSTTNSQNERSSFQENHPYNNSLSNNAHFPPTDSSPSVHFSPVPTNTPLFGIHPYPFNNTLFFNFSFWCSFTFQQCISFQ
jgi:hypothetical protein